MKKRYMIVSVVLAVFFLMCLSANAVDEKVKNISNVGFFVYNQNVKNMIQSFDETNEGWDVAVSGNANERVTLSESISAFPYEPLSGDGSLIYRNSAAKSGKANRISKKYAVPLDLSDSSYLIIAANCTEVPNSSYKISVELKSGRRSFTAEGSIDPCSWNCVFVDISDFSYRKSVDTVNISVFFENNEKTAYNFEYYIDSIACCAGAETANGLLYSAGDYLLSDGSSAVENGSLAFSAQEGVVELFSSGFVYKNMDNANCLKVIFSYDGICMAINAHVIYADGQTADFASVIEEDGGQYLAYVPVGEKEISEIKLGFDVTGGQRIEIESIEPYSSFVGQSAGSDTCALNYNTGEIIIRGSVGNHQQEELHLFVNELCDEITPETLNNQQSVAKSIAGTSDYIFRIKYSDHTDPKSYLFKKFTVAAKTENGYAVIGNPKCITNPENYTEQEGSEAKRGSGKGVYGQSVEFMQEMGVSDTVVWVDIGRFFTLNEGGEFMYGGNVIYYDINYVNSLNAQLRSFREKDIDVTLVAVLTRGQNDELNKILIHPEADKDAKYCAYNTTSKLGLSYLRAFAEFVGEMYCKNGTVSGFCLGEGVALRENYSMGEKTLERFTVEYGNALRIVYNALKSYSPDVEIFAYIDDNWDGDLSFDLYTRYDNRAFISSLGRYLASCGDIGWSLAQNPYPRRMKNYYSYSDGSLLSSHDTDRVSFRNIGVLSSYLSSDFLQHHNSVREYIIIEKSQFSGIDEQMLTADYVYNCYKALTSSASAYITDRKCNHNDAMKLIDTNLSLTASSFASDVLGVATWENVIEGFSEEKIIKTEISSINALPTAPKYKGSTVIADFSENTDGFSRYGFSERLNGGMSLLEKEGLLSVALGKIPKGQKRGIVKKFDTPLDLSKTPILHFDVNIASLPQGVNTAEVVVVLKSEGRVIEVTGMIKEAVWTGMYCDLSSFAGLNKVEEMRITVSSPEIDYEGPQTLISSIEALSTEYDDEQLAEFFDPSVSENGRMEQIRKYAVPLLVILSVFSLAVFIIRRFAKR